MSEDISLFIIGLPRSGTKLIRELLNNHNDIYIPSIEAYFIPHLIRKYGNRKLNGEEVVSVIQEIKTSLFFFYYAEKHQFDFSKFNLEDITVNDLIYLIWKELAIKELGKTVKVLGDKTPRNISHIKLLLDSFSNCKIIHIVRDPRDNVLSAKNTWNKNIFRTAYKWQLGVDNLKKYRNNRERIMEVKYEDLIVSPKEVLKDLCNFIGVSYQCGMDKLQIDVENKGGFIDGSNFNNYKTGLSKSELEYVERLTKKGLEHYGYKLESKDCKFISYPGLPKLLFWQAQDVINLALYNIREHGILRGIEKMKKAHKHA